MTKPKVFITRKWPASIEAKLKQHYDVTLNIDDRPLNADEFKLAAFFAGTPLPDQVI